jgi:hypothetical protein
LIGFNKIFITKFQAVYMGFLNYNIIFDIDISNYETDYIKIRHDFWSRGVFCRIYAVKGKEISIFLQIWTRKYVYL